MKHNDQLTLTLTRRELLLGWSYLAFQLLLLPAALILLFDALEFHSEAAVNLCYYGINAAACALLFRKLLCRSARNLRGRIDDFLEAVILGFLWYYLGSGLVGILNAFLWPDFANINDANVLDMVTQMPVLMTLAVVMLAPFAEECLFRGLIFVPLARKNAILGYVFTTLAFSAIHVVGYIGEYAPAELAVAMVQYLPTAALCWACRKADSLLAPMAVHALINTTTLFLLR